MMLRTASPFCTPAAHLSGVTSWFPLPHVLLLSPLCSNIQWQACSSTLPTMCLLLDAFLQAALCRTRRQLGHYSVSKQMGWHTIGAKIGAGDEVCQLAKGVCLGKSCKVHKSIHPPVRNRVTPLQGLSDLQHRPGPSRAD